MGEYHQHRDNIIAHPTPDHAEAAVAQVFTSQEQLSITGRGVIGGAPGRVWNSLADVKPLKSFKGAKVAASRVWGSIQGLAEPETPKAATNAKGRAQAAHVAPARGKATRKATLAKNAPRAKRAAKKTESGGPREGTKMAGVVADAGAQERSHAVEVSERMGWQRHYADVQIMPTCVGNPAFGAGIAAMESA